jgi:hypothetical protein
MMTATPDPFESETTMMLKDDACLMLIGPQLFRVDSPPGVTVGFLRHPDARWHAFLGPDQADAVPIGDYPHAMEAMGRVIDLADILRRLNAANPLLHGRICHVPGLEHTRASHHPNRAVEPLWPIEPIDPRD